MLSDSISKYRYSFIAGGCAAFGSGFGKLPSTLEAHHLLRLQRPATTIEWLLIHIIPFALMIICNVLNWRYFLKALQRTEQTLTSTVLTAASNYLFSFVIAAFVYRETHSVLSACGSALIMLGLWLLCNDGQPPPASAEQPPKKLS